MSNVISIATPSTNSSKWLVPGFIAKNSLSIIYGDMPKMNCSVANMIASCLVSGESWCGNEINSQSSVLYIGEVGYKTAVSNGRGVSLRDYPYKLFVADNPINLLNQWQVKELVKQLSKRNGLVNKGLSLIIIEMSTSGFADPVELVSVADTVKSLNYILEKTGVSILLVHTDYGARRLGLRVLSGMADVALKIENVCYSSQKR
ncbi:MAG: AAA family ATPase, partial [Colwellia sp.]|nr:AAA family ATPase [Colwellia sp.]